MIILCPENAKHHTSECSPESVCSVKSEKIELPDTSIAQRQRFILKVFDEVRLRGEDIVAWQVCATFCLHSLVEGDMVGETGIEPATPCTPCRCATKLRYSPATRRIA